MWSAAPAHDEGVAWLGWAEIGWVRVLPIGRAGNGQKLIGFPLRTFLVLVVPERISEREVYLDAGRTLCRMNEFCHVTYLSKFGGPFTWDVIAKTEPYYLGAYIKSDDGEVLNVPCKSANIEGCDQ